MGAEIYLYLTYQGPEPDGSCCSPTSKSRRGDKIVVAMDTHKIHLFDPESEKTLLNLNSHALYSGSVAAGNRFC